MSYRSCCRTILLAKNEQKVRCQVLNFRDWIRKQLTQPETRQIRLHAASSMLRKIEMLRF